jgi:hypothetical protein
MDFWLLGSQERLGSSWGGLVGGLTQVLSLACAGRLIDGLAVSRSFVVILQNQAKDFLGLGHDL